jgi:heme/copper-type cytochrome/quinol oxidase subunit 1
MLRAVRASSWVVAGGALLLVAGCLVFWQGQRQGTASFGWFAYAPLASPPRHPDYLPSGPWRLRTWAGLGSAGLGLVMASSGLGYRLGRRRAGI